MQGQDPGKELGMFSSGMSGREERRWEEIPAGLTGQAKGSLADHHLSNRRGQLGGQQTLVREVAFGRQPEGPEVLMTWARRQVQEHEGHLRAGYLDSEAALPTWVRREDAAKDVDRPVCREQEQDEKGRCQGHVAKMEADPEGPGREVQAQQEERWVGVGVREQGSPPRALQGAAPLGLHLWWEACCVS